MPALKLTSYGATGEVTGSCHLLQYGSFRLLIDCGFFQGGEDNYQKNNQPFGFDHKKINAVILTHAHLDHCGRLPRLLSQGYRGPIYATAPTRDLAQIILADNLHIMQEHALKHKLPLAYKESDLKKLNNYWQLLDYYQTLRLNKQISLTLYNAGHILGSAIVEIRAGDKIIIFSGDLGAINMPLVKDVDYRERADYVVIEGTYGDRRHQTTTERDARLLQIVQKVVEKNSTLLISVFAVERAQDILRVLNDYYEKHLDFRVPVYLDSPLAIQATQIYRRYSTLLNPAAQEDLRHDPDIFNFPHLKITRQVRQSQTIKSAPNPKIILAGAGMAEGGRILAHLARYAPDPKNILLFTGFQVPGTLGHHLINGAFDFHYYSQPIPVRAKVEQLDAFSAHADQDALLRWLGYIKNPREIFLAHGDALILHVWADKIRSTLGCPAKILETGQSEDLG